MKTQSIDTSPEAERVLISMLRSTPISRRFSIVQSWSRSMVEAGKFDVQQLSPKATMQEVCLLYMERHYGKDLVNGLRVVLRQRNEQFSGVLDFQTALVPLVGLFCQLDITYALTGSLASSLYGMPRATMQLEIIADLDQWHRKLVIEQLGSQYVLVKEVKTSFTFMHLESFLKIVVTLPYSQDTLKRACLLHLSDELSSISVLSPEDIAILQLEQFKASGERADDIWYDLLGLLKVQGTALGLAYVEHWAVALDVSDLLEHALVEAGLRQL